MAFDGEKKFTTNFKSPAWGLESKGHLPYGRSSGLVIRPAVIRDKGPPLDKANRERNACTEKQPRSMWYFLIDWPLTWLLPVAPPGMTDSDDSSALYCGVAPFLPGLVSAVLSLWLSHPLSPNIGQTNQHPPHTWSPKQEDSGLAPTASFPLLPFI